jgi:DNA processing protein
MQDQLRWLCLQLGLFSQLAPQDCLPPSSDPAIQPLVLARKLLREEQPCVEEILALLESLKGKPQLPGFAELSRRCLSWAEQPGQQILTLADTAYPALLREIADPPAALFMRTENSQLVDLPQLAIVGSRKPTADGRRLAQRFARELGEAGYLTTSGLALGIDAAAHQGALQAAAGTIAVLGSGLDAVYPLRNRQLAQSIVAHGALVSEFAPDTPARAWQFPRRNRIISGLSHGVLVVEAARASGSLITAGLAAVQGRTVFAIPGAIHNPQVRGCHELLRQGAVLVESLDDIAGELGAMLTREQLRAGPASAGLAQQLAQQKPGKGTLQASLLEQIAYNPVSADHLSAALNRTVEELYPQLLQLELDGLVEHSAAGYVRRH